MTPQEEHVMKKNICNLAVLTVFAMALAGISLAQDETYRVRVNIPFDFYAGDQQLPAGSYVFNVDYENHLVSLRNHDTGRTYMVLAAPADGQGSGEASVEFDVAGDNHLLADLKTASSGVSFAENKQVLSSALRRGSIAIVAELR
jgi:hypothetical protein